MDNYSLFKELLTAETEDELDAILRRHDLFVDDMAAWRLFGDSDNNFAIVSNQAAEPTAALVEKVVNGIDAVLMRACFDGGIDPEGPTAPTTMADAVRDFFGVRDGRIATLSAAEQTKLAQQVNLVAVGEKERPSYLIIDRGEGQTPDRFPDTLVSLNRSNKLRIPFVQGKFNAGGTAILQFCGTKNYELIVSRRHPSCPVDPEDTTAQLWGFTLVRRMLPAGGRRSSQYVYLAPGGKVPSFAAPSIRVLPGGSGPRQPGQPYSEELEYGTVIKLYEYRWPPKSMATRDARYALERVLHSPALPFRITETRPAFQANYYATTLSGAWAGMATENKDEESEKVEPGFPAAAEIMLASTGRLPYQIAVYKDEVNPRRIPHGVFFTINGQVQGSLPAEFIARRLKFDYLARWLLVSIDCTGMNEQVREDFFMASRDRIRHNEVYEEIVSKLATDLREHPGLRELNAQRRRKHLEKALADEKGTVEFFQDLINKDPALAGLLSGGDRLVAMAGSGEETPFHGRKFPAFFRLQHEPKTGLVKGCPANRATRIDFVTDAVNDYFERADSPGRMNIEPAFPERHWHLWNGRGSMRVRPPAGAQMGDLIPVTVMVADAERDVRGGPFVCRFTLRVEAPIESEPPGEPRPRPKDPRRPQPSGQQAPVLAMPKIYEISREQWEKQEPSFDEYTALRIHHADDGSLDFLVNIDNVSLLREMTRAKQGEDKPLIKHWFKYGLALCAMGMLQDVRPHAHAKASVNGKSANGPTAEGKVDLHAPDEVGRFCDGLARVIVPIVRHLHDSPGVGAPV